MPYNVFGMRYFRDDGKWGIKKGRENTISSAWYERNLDKKGCESIFS
jgi:hypothetical protein